MSSVARGVLIAVEGADGAGTTTQCRRLAAWLTGRGRPVHATREPSDGAIGRLLRGALTGAGEARGLDDPLVMALLFAADRVDHLRREIEPALAAGAVVLTDRYVLSSLVYQSLAAPREFVAQANRFARAPELTVLLDVAPELAAARRARRGGPAELFETEAAQREVIARYRREADTLAAGGARTLVVDGGADEDTVFAALRGAIAEVCHLPAAELAS